MTVTVHAKKVVQKKIGSIKPYPRNARTHPPEQVDLLAKLISDSGFTTPILIEPDGTIIAGHGRYAAAQKLGMETVPCVVVEGLSAAKLRSLRLSDNKLGLLSGWDENLLKLELFELNQLGFDMPITGFSEEELAKLFPAPSNPSAPDAFPGYDEGIVTTYKCPGCGFSWSGKAHS